MPTFTIIHIVAVSAGPVYIGYLEHSLLRDADMKDLLLFDAARERDRALAPSKIRSPS